MEKNIKSHIIHKHDTAKNWAKALRFIPKQGELIVYDIDEKYNYERFKIGDGITKVNDLPFVDEFKVDKVEGKGLSTNDFTNEHVTKLTSIPKADKIATTDYVNSAIENIEFPESVTSYNDLTDKPQLTAVATSGSYNDLNDKPCYDTRNKKYHFRSSTTSFSLLEDVSGKYNVKFSNVNFPSLQNYQYYWVRVAYTLWNGQAKTFEKQLRYQINSFQQNLGSIDDELYLSYNNVFGTLMVYFPKQDNGISALIVEIYEESGSLIQLDEKYIPNTIARKSDVPSLEGFATEEYVDNAITNIDIPEGAGSSAIIDVTALPTENINENVFYRLLTGTMVVDKASVEGLTCICVEELPSVGVPATNADMSQINVYYNVTDEILYGYVDDMLSDFFGVPIGWYPAEMLFQLAEIDYKGVITNILDDPEDGGWRLLLERVICQYKGVWTSLKPIGRAGTGPDGEIFNHIGNEASGYSSHAEGVKTHARGHISHAEGLSTTADGDNSHSEGSNTTASGECSHSEGSVTTAGGRCSHSEGFNTTASSECSHSEGSNTTASSSSSHSEGEFTTASGRFSHSEGSNTTASGECSHSEGSNTTASGESSHSEGSVTTAGGRCSHSEGFNTTASGRFSHVQGIGNIEDRTEKYAHIVGNGFIVPSNAHTLDWNGLGWFQGGLKVGGTGQDDENAEEIPTKSQVQEMINEALGVIENGTY